MNIRVYEYRSMHDQANREHVAAKSSSDASHQLAYRLSDEGLYDPQVWFISGVFPDPGALISICEEFRRHLLKPEFADTLVQHADVDQGLLLISEFASFLATRRDQGI
jgi:hypothetical protein